jgi:hypothetical protein
LPDFVAVDADVVLGVGDQVARVLVLAPVARQLKDMAHGKSLRIGAAGQALVARGELFSAVVGQLLAIALERVLALKIKLLVIGQAV